MKYILLITLILTISNVSYYTQTSTPGTDVLTLKEAIIQTGQGTKSVTEAIKQTKIFSDIKKAQEEIKKAMEKYEAIKNLQSMKQLYESIGATACLSRRLNMLMEIDINLTNSCLFQVQYQQAILNHSFAMETINLVVTAGTIMKTEGRIKTISDAVEKVDLANKTMMDLINKLEKKVNHRITADVESLTRMIVAKGTFNQYTSDL